MLGVGLGMMATSASATLIAIQMVLTIVCAIVSLRIRDYS